MKVTFTFVQRWILGNVCLRLVSMNRHRSELSDGSSFWALNSVDAVTRRRALNMWCVDALKEWGWYWRQWGAGVLTMVRWNNNNQSESSISLCQPIRIWYWYFFVSTNQNPVLLTCSWDDDLRRTHSLWDWLPLQLHHRSVARCWAGVDELSLTLIKPEISLITPLPLQTGSWNSINQSE